MKRWRFYMGAVVGTGVIVVILVLANATPAIGQSPFKPLEALIVNPVGSPVPVTVVGGGAVTHMGVSPSAHVVLNWFGTGSPTSCGTDKFERQRQDGTFETEEFVVPAGQLLVVTDVDAELVAGTGETFLLGDSVSAKLGVPANFGAPTSALHSTDGVSIANQTTGAVSVSSQLVSGAVVAAGQPLCIRGTSLASSSGTVFLEVHSSVVRGYLIAAP